MRVPIRHTVLRLPYPLEVRCEKKIGQLVERRSTPLRLPYSSFSLPLHLLPNHLFRFLPGKAVYLLQSNTPTFVSTTNDGSNLLLYFISTIAGLKYA